MKISRLWLEKFFDTELPDTDTLVQSLTLHAFEVDGVEKVGDDDIIDVKITPNRGHDCLSHRGVAKELGAILNIKVASDPLNETPSLEPLSDKVSVLVEDKKLSPRYIACHVEGIKIGPSPKWLKEKLEAVGQRSINNVVDITNFVMLNVGQPIHAFDADKLLRKDGKYSIAVRRAKNGEKMMTLDGKEYELLNSMLIIADGNSDKALAVAGVKGGTLAEITEETNNIIIESANFDGVSVRKTSQALKLRTDASHRFEQVISPELSGYGMRLAVDMILENASLSGKEKVEKSIGFVDVRSVFPEQKKVKVSASQINNILGTSISSGEIEGAFTRLGFNFSLNNEEYEVSVPFERLDILIPEDLAEEVARMVGYEKVIPAELSVSNKIADINKSFYLTEKLSSILLSLGFSQTYTSVFRSEESGRAVSNKVGGERPNLRPRLGDGVMESLLMNERNTPLLSLDEIRIFEIGKVFGSYGEFTNIAIGVSGKNSKKIIDGLKEQLSQFVGGLEEKITVEGNNLILEIENLEKSAFSVSGISKYDKLEFKTPTRYAPFSKYPFIARDIAVWTPEDVMAEKVENLIRAKAGDLLAVLNLFDQFSAKGGSASGGKKEGKVSYAFHLVFQSFEKTLSDDEVNKIMDKVTTLLNSNDGWVVR